MTLLTSGFVNILDNLIYPLEITEPEQKAVLEKNIAQKSKEILCVILCTFCVERHNLHKQDCPIHVLASAFKIVVRYCGIFFRKLKGVSTNTEFQE